MQVIKTNRHLLEGLRAACQKIPRTLVFRARCSEKITIIFVNGTTTGLCAEVAFYAHLFCENRLIQNSSVAAAIASPQALPLQITD